MSEQIYVMDYQELDILEAICGVQKYWGIVSGPKMDLRKVNHRLFEMYQKKMIYPENGFYQIEEEYKKLLQYINAANAMLKIKIKGDYQQDCFCYVKENILVVTDNARKAGQARYEFIKKEKFGQFLMDGEYLPEKEGANLENLEYGLSIIQLNQNGTERDILEITEEDGLFFIYHGVGQHKKKELFTLDEFENILWMMVEEE